VGRIDPAFENCISICGLPHRGHRALRPAGMDIRMRSGNVNDDEEMHYVGASYVWYSSRFRSRDMCCGFLPTQRRNNEQKANVSCIQRFRKRQRMQSSHLEIQSHEQPAVQRILHGPLFLPFLPPTTPFPPPPPPCCCGTGFLAFNATSCPTAVSTAISKISCTPSISLLLHSTYVAPICFATLAPCSGVTGVRPWVFSRSMQARLVRRSDFRPTRMRGVVGQKWRTSGYHWEGIRWVEERGWGGKVPCP